MQQTENNSSIRIRCGRRIAQTALMLFAMTTLLPAQDDLTLRQAVHLALRSNPLVAAADAGEGKAEARIQQARSGYLPHANFSESFQRSNNPVFVFTSLLTQQQLSERNLEIGTVNHPEALNNYQSQLTVENHVNKNKSR